MILGLLTSAAANDADGDFGGLVVAIFSVIGGALVAAVAGFVGAAIQHRREHRRWIRERRYEAFVKVRAVLDELNLMGVYLDRAAADLRKAEKLTDESEKREATRRANARSEDLSRRLGHLRETLAGEMAPIRTLGPDDVTNALGRAAAVEHDSPELDRVMFELAKAMRGALEIKD